MYGWKLEWAQDAHGEIGKVPKLPAGVVEIDITRGSLLEEWPAMSKRARR